MRAGIRRHRGDVIDALLAAVLAVIGVVSVVTPDSSAAYQFRAPSAGLVVLALVAALPLAVRRRWPLTVGLIVVAATVTIGAMRWNAGIYPFLVMFALYTIACGRGLRVALGGLGFAYAGLGVLVILRVPYFDNSLAVMFFLFLTAAWGFGRWMRLRQAERGHAVARAVTAERIRAAEAERAVLAERLRIARELHDVVSHTLSVIAVQSGTARLRLARGDDGSATAEAVTALTAIETGSRGALADLRRMLGPLRAAPTAAGPAYLAAPDASSRRPVHEGLVDVVAAVVLGALGVGLAFVRDPTLAYVYARPDALLIGLILAACLSLAVRRRWPLPVLALAVAATVATSLLGWNADWPGFAAYLALYTVAAWRRLPIAAAGLVLLVAGDTVLWLAAAPHFDPAGDIAGALVPWIVGLAVRRRRRQRDAALERALEVERTRASAAERAVFAERLRIAGELHDVVAHTLSAVAVQAAVMRHHLAGRTGIAADTLSVVEEASRSALDDLRRMLGILHDDEEQASLTPTPSLDELAVLVSAHRAAGGPVELSVDPPAAAAPPSVQLTVFRLIQEALTNARKHATGAPVHVRVGVDGDDVLVAVQNDAPAVTGPALDGGFGLEGMRERVALFGGRFTAAPRADGGFGVQAVLPGALAGTTERAVPA
jgi:signal transduction histidine kinase